MKIGWIEVLSGHGAEVLAKHAVPVLLRCCCCCFYGLFASNETWVRFCPRNVRHFNLFLTFFSVLSFFFLSDYRFDFRAQIIYPTMPVDLLNPSPELELRTHKLKRLVQSPNSFFMDIKCPGCFQITTVFSHAQSVVLCGNCNIMLCQPTGGKARLTEGCSYRKKVD